MGRPADGATLERGHWDHRIQERRRLRLLLRRPGFSSPNPADPTRERAGECRGSLVFGVLHSHTAFDGLSGVQASILSVLLSAVR